MHMTTFTKKFRMNRLGKIESKHQTKISSCMYSCEKEPV